MLPPADEPVYLDGSSPRCAAAGLDDDDDEAFVAIFGPLTKPLLWSDFGFGAAFDAALSFERAIAIR